MADALGKWEPASLAAVRDWMAPVGAPWWIAGGYAIELAVGSPVREHGDVDVLLLRKDQLAAQRALPTWEWWAADPPGTLRPWETGETLPEDVHDIWCRPGPDRPWAVQFMLDESEGDQWVSRRDPRLRRPVSTLGRTGPGGIPYLAAEIQLYYKAKGMRPKDEADFTAALPVLEPAQRRWLREALERTHPGHAWSGRLGGPPSREARTPS